MNTVEKDTLKQEEWKSIPGYDGKYEISNWGRVKSYKQNSNGKILSPGNNGLGYYFVCLFKGKKEKKIFVHRLVAEAFIPNSNNLPEVNHKDEGKGNNHVTNLEWCSRAYNLAYGTRVERISKRVVQLDKGGNFIAEFESINEAARRTGISSINICYCCKHKKGYKSRGGFIWIYKDEYLNTQTQQEK